VDDGHCEGIRIYAGEEDRVATVTLIVEKCQELEKDAFSSVNQLQYSVQVSLLVKGHVELEQIKKFTLISIPGVSHSLILQ
jgi:hypothetical protein